MFKKINFKSLDYKDLERFDSHGLKRDNLNNFYQTFDFLELVNKWPEIVGPMMSQVTSPLKIQNGSLFILSKHANYSHELSYLAEDIKKAVFSFFPNLKPVINKISFKTQETFFSQPKENKSNSPIVKLHPQSPQFKILKLEAERLFRDVPDQELKDILISIYIQSH